MLDDNNIVSPQSDANDTNEATKTPQDDINTAATDTAAPQADNFAADGAEKVSDGTCVTDATTKVSTTTTEAATDAAPVKKTASAGKKKKKKRKIWPFVILGVLAVGFAAFILFVILIIFIIALSSTSTSVFPSFDEKYVAVLHINDEISGDYVTTSMYGQTNNYDQVYLVDTICSLVDDENNAGLMLYIDSPGGEVLATDELAGYISYYKETTGRPVYAYFSYTAASGAYWLGSYADTIIANPYCTTGSIGVTYGTHLDISGMLEKLGITATSLTAGDNKAMGSMYEPLTAEQKAMYEEQLEEIYAVFVNVVAQNRGLDVQSVARIADGRTFLASKALEYGLIDGIGYYSEAQSLMIECEGFDEEILFHDFYDVYDSGISMFLTEAVEKFASKSNGDTDEVSEQVIAELCEKKRFMCIFEG